MVNSIAAALGQKCPRCGRGRLYKSYARLVDRCEVCDLPLGENDTGDGPAVMLIFLLGFTVVPLIMWWGFTFDPPLWVIAIVAVIAIFGTTLALLPATKALFVAENYRHNPWD
ncbi:MAG: DUF983 domain-containing protein [Pseudomonadota bacterium]